MICYMDSEDPYCIYLQTFGEATNVYMEYETQDPAEWEYHVTCINVLEASFVLDNTTEDTLPEGMKVHPEEEVVVDQEVFSSLMWAALHDCTNFIFFMDS